MKNKIAQEMYAVAQFLIYMEQFIIKIATVTPGTTGEQCLERARCAVWLIYNYARKRGQEGPFSAVDIFIEEVEEYYLALVKGEI